MQNHRHLFVSGLKRSGTTLLQLVLSAHPEITVTPEAQFPNALSNQDWAPDKPLGVEELAVVSEALLQDRKLSEWPGFNVEAFVSRELEGDPRRIGEVLDSIFLEYARVNGTGTGYIGNKKGLYSNKKRALWIKGIFPECRLVFIVRDPRDAVRSALLNLRAPRLERATKICARRGRHYHALVEMFPDDVIVIRYEDLVTEPAETCLRLCDFLEVAYDEQMLAYHRRNREGQLLLRSTKVIHHNTTTPFNPELIAQWRRDESLSAEDVEYIEREMEDFMEWFGYDK